MLVKGHGLAEKVQTPKMTNPHNKIAFSLLRMLLKGALYITLRPTWLIFLHTHCLPCAAKIKLPEVPKLTQNQIQWLQMTQNYMWWIRVTQGESKWQESFWKEHDGVCWHKSPLNPKGVRMRFQDVSYAIKSTNLLSPSIQYWISYNSGIFLSFPWSFNDIFTRLFKGTRLIVLTQYG